jgi:hypothetical protein
MVAAQRKCIDSQRAKRHPPGLGFNTPMARPAQQHDIPNRKLLTIEADPTDDPGAVMSMAARPETVKLKARGRATPGARTAEQFNQFCPRLPRPKQIRFDTWITHRKALR